MFWMGRAEPPIGVLSPPPLRRQMHTGSGRVLLGRARVAVVASLCPPGDARPDAKYDTEVLYRVLRVYIARLGICALKLLACGRDIFLSRTDHVAEVRTRTASRERERDMGVYRVES